MLEVSNLNVYYGKMPAVRDVSFKVLEREVVSIIGGNGAGKSTLLKSVASHIFASSGRIKFLNKKIDHLPSHHIVEMGLVLIPEGRKIFPFMTVRENLELGAYTKRAKGRRKASLHEVFDLFPIFRERQNQFAGTLSGGEQQMLAIGRGLMSLPKLLMLDEPSMGLAPSIVRGIFHIIKGINEKETTILLVEQNIYNALLLSHRGYVLENGSIVLEGTGKDLVKNEHVRTAYLGI